MRLLAVARNGKGSVKSSPVGISCGRDCEEAYVTGTVVTLTATRGSGYQFSSWSGACRGANASCTVTLKAARSVTATFVPR
jgi:hypothetical protein